MGVLDANALPALLTLQATLRAAEPQRLAPFLGPALHGALGRAMYRTVCVFAHRQSCPGCPLQNRCAYPNLFAPAMPVEPTLQQVGIRDTAPRPLVLAPEPLTGVRAGGSWELAANTQIGVRVTLIGRAIAELPFVVIALQKAANRGIGIATDGDFTDESQRPGLELVSVATQDGRLVYDGTCDHYQAIGPEPLPRSDPPRAVEINFLTPLRLKVNGKVASRITASDLCTALARRANALSVLYGSGTPCIDERTIDESAANLHGVARLSVQHVRRYSSRQRTRMEWPGLVGTMRLSGDALAAVWSLLVWGEQAQVGKATGFGFGRYALRAAGAEAGGSAGQ